MARKIVSNIKLNNRKGFQLLIIILFTMYSIMISIWSDIIWNSSKEDCWLRIRRSKW